MANFLDLNLTLLKRRFPEVAAFATSERNARFSVLKSQDGGIYYAKTEPGGSTLPLSNPRNPAGSAQQALESMRPRLTEGFSPALIIGLAPGYLLDAVYRYFESRLEHAEQFRHIYVVVDSPLCLLGWLASGDRSKIISRTEVEFHLASQVSRIVELCEKDLSRSHHFIPLSELPLAVVEPIIRPLAALFLKREQEAEAWRKENEAYYKSISDTELAATLLGKSGRKPRLLMPTHLASTVIQFSARDTCELFGHAGWETQLLKIQRDLPPWHLIKAIYDFKPDLFIFIDHLRTEDADCQLYPPDMLFATWVQDSLPAINSKEAAKTWNKRSEGRLRDFVIGYAGQLAPYGYDQTRLFEMPMAVNAGIFRPVELTEEDKAKYGCDVCFASNRGRSCEEVVKLELLPAISSLGFTLDSLYEVHTLLWREYRAGRSIRSYEELEKTLCKLDSFASLYLTLQPEGKDLCLQRIFWILNDLIYRYAVLEWLDDYAQAHPAFKLKLYGRVWSKHPRFAKYDAGAVEHGPNLNKAYNAARFCLHLNSLEGQHQRLLEIVASGARPLLRRAEPIDEPPPQAQSAPQSPQDLLAEELSELCRIAFSSCPDAAKSVPQMLAAIDDTRHNGDFLFSMLWKQRGFAFFSSKEQFLSLLEQPPEQGRPSLKLPSTAEALLHFISLKLFPGMREARLPELKALLESSLGLPAESLLVIAKAIRTQSPESFKALLPLDAASLKGRLLRQIETCKLQEALRFLRDGSCSKDDALGILRSASRQTLLTQDGLAAFASLAGFLGVEEALASIREDFYKAAPLLKGALSAYASEELARNTQKALLLFREDCQLGRFLPLWRLCYLNAACAMLSSDDMRLAAPPPEEHEDSPAPALTSIFGLLLNAGQLQSAFDLASKLQPQNSEAKLIASLALSLLCGEKPANIQTPAAKSFLAKSILELPEDVAASAELLWKAARCQVQLINDDASPSFESLWQSLLDECRAETCGDGFRLCVSRLAFHAGRLDDAASIMPSLEKADASKEQLFTQTALLAFYRHRRQELRERLEALRKAESPALSLGPVCIHLDLSLSPNALANLPDAWKPAQSLFNLFLVECRLEEAEALLQEEQSPLLRAYLMARLGLHEEFLAEYRLGEIYKSRSQALWMDLTLSLVSLGRGDEAVALLNAANTLAWRLRPWLQRFKLFALLRLDRAEEALALAESLEKAYPQISDFIPIHAFAALNCGKAEAAALIMAEGGERACQIPGGRLVHAMSLEGCDRREAEQLLAEELAENPHLLAAHAFAQLLGVKPLSSFNCRKHGFSPALQRSLACFTAAMRKGDKAKAKIETISLASYFILGYERILSGLREHAALYGKSLKTNAQRSRKRKMA